MVGINSTCAQHCGAIVWTNEPSVLTDLSAACSLASKHRHHFCIGPLNEAADTLYRISLHTLGSGLSFALTFGLRGTAISALFSAGSLPLYWFPSALRTIAAFIWSVVGVQET